MMQICVGGRQEMLPLTLDSLAVVLLSPATSTRVQRSYRDTAGLLCASKLCRQPRSRRPQYRQTNLHSNPFPSRQPENRIKYPVILCCLRGKHTDLIITSRLADGAMHLQLRGELFPKTITITAAATSERKGLWEGSRERERYGN